DALGEIAGVGTARRRGIDPPRPSKANAHRVQQAAKTRSIFSPAEIGAGLYGSPRRLEKPEAFSAREQTVKEGRQCLFVNGQTARSFPRSAVIWVVENGVVNVLVRVHSTRRLVWCQTLFARREWFAGAPSLPPPP